MHEHHGFGAVVLCSDSSVFAELEAMTTADIAVLGLSDMKSVTVKILRLWRMIFDFESKFFLCTHITKRLMGRAQQFLLDSGG